MDERHFWRLIAELGRQTDDVAMARLFNALDSLSEAELESFATHLAKAVHDLDTERLFRQPFMAGVVRPGEAAEDRFVAVRCSVIACGRGAFDMVRAVPGELSRRTNWPVEGAERLLSMAGTMYERKVGQPWPFTPPWPTRTASNLAGWAATPQTPAPLPALTPTPLAAAFNRRPQPANTDRPEPVIRVHYSYNDPAIGRLAGDPSWSVALVDTTHRAVAAVDPDGAILAQVEGFELSEVSVVMQFIDSEAGPVHLVNRYGGELEIVLGRYLPEARAVDADQLEQWVRGYLRDSLDLGLHRLRDHQRATH